MQILYFRPIFALEALIKIVGLGKQYFLDRWNLFDFIIVIGSFIGFFVDIFFKDMNMGTTATLLRTFRFGRMMKMFRKLNSLKLIFNTFISALPALSNVGGLLMLLIYIYSVLGMNLFAHVKINGHLHKILNFQNIFTSFLTLIRAATGENFHEVMWAIGRNTSITYQCIQHPEFHHYESNGYETVGCGHAILAILYFGTYILIVALIFLNLFIAIILQGYAEANKKNKDGKFH